MSSTRWQEIWRKRLQQLKEPLVASEMEIKNQISDFSQRPVNFLQKIKQKMQRLWFNLRTMKKSRLFALFAFFAFLCVFLGSIFTGILLVVLAKDLPQPGKIVRREGFATKIYDRDGNLIYDVFEEQRRTPVELHEIPDHLKQATIAIEDKDFYSHKGFDPKGYLRSIYYVFRGRRLAGGSTLTQQLVKNVLLTSERSIIRKIKEFVLALEIEASYSKDEILQMYLNEAPYGGTAWGVEEAARTYFGKGVTELNLTESAILAGLPQSPSYYSPFSESKAYEGRTEAVIRRMREDGYISVEEEKKSLGELADIQFASRSGTLKAPHFVMYVKKLLEDKYGEKAVELGGLRVTTSIDLDLQEKAQEIVAEEIAKVDNDKYHITNGATIVMNPQTGEILAMVGSKNYDDPDYDGKFNVVTSKNRQPGSTIKPVTYVTALKKGYTASTLLMDTLTRFPVTGDPDYVPTNYDNQEHGPMQMRYSLGNSINITAVKMLSLVGIKDMLATAYEMGITSLESTAANLSRLGLSVTLGGGEVSLLDLTTSYSAFANTGYKVEPVAILKVTDKDGNVLEEFKSMPGKRVLSEGEAFIISHILSDNSARMMTFGENNLLKFTGRQVAAKTGTTNDRKDNWTIGWTPQVIVGTWVGNNDNTPMKALVSGVTGAAPIWRKVISEYLKDKPVVEFAIPADVVTAEVDVVSGYRAHDGFPSRSEYFIKGTEPVGDDPVHQKLKICKGQGKLATPVDIARGDYDEKEYFTFKENDPFMKDGVNQWQAGIDAWVAKQSDERYRPPTEYCSSMDQVHVSLEPGDQSQVDSSFNVKVEPTSAHDITKVEIFVNGESKKTFTSPPYEIGLTLQEGKYTIKAEVTDSEGNKGSAESRIGVKIPWDWEPTPTPTPTPTPRPTKTKNPTIAPSPTTAVTPSS